MTFKERDFRGEKGVIEGNFLSSTVLWRKKESDGQIGLGRILSSTGGLRKAAWRYSSTMRKLCRKKRGEGRDFSLSAREGGGFLPWESES